MVYKWQDVPIEEILYKAGLVPQRPGRKKKKSFKKLDLFNIVCAFDIETTKVYTDITNRITGETQQHPHSFMYVWQFQIGEQYTIIGRTWDQFIDFQMEVLRISHKYKTEHNTDTTPALVVYVHNLSYEFQFLAGIYNFKDQECFFFKSRVPLKVSMWDCFEFRCSYKHSNMSLDKFCKQMGCTTQKLDGKLFDYHKERYPWTELTEYELQYCINDVVGLQQAIRRQMWRDGDDLISIPLTSTGYVRREIKVACWPLRKTLISWQLPMVPQYILLRKAFRGGNTHANVYTAGRIIDNVHSVDMASCYPAQQLTKKFPMKPFQMLCNPSPTSCADFIKKGFAVVAQYQFTKLQLKNNTESIPYLPYSKCQCCYADGFNVRCDNGRILYADYLQTTLTEIDLQIILKQYTFQKIGVISAMVASKDYLPQPFRDTVQDYYNRKTTLKAESARNKETAYYYTKAKNKLNACYGMSCQDPVHNDVKYNGGDWKEIDLFFTQDGQRTDKPKEIARDLYNQIVKKLQEATFPYQWGVYVAAYARKALQDGIDLVNSTPGATMIYCDTDSVKYSGTVDWSALNDQRKHLAEENGAFATDTDGIPHYMGVFQQDGIYTQFITQGAKRYAYTDKKGMHVTVAGVSHPVNDAGQDIAAVQLGTLDNFKSGMKWVQAGSVAAIYNDQDNFDIEREGRKIHIGKNVALQEVSYTMDIRPDYLRLIQETELYGHWLKQGVI